VPEQKKEVVPDTVVTIPNKPKKELPKIEENKVRQAFELTASKGLSAIESIEKVKESLTKN